MLQEIDDLLSGGLTQEDEDEVLSELQDIIQVHHTGWATQHSHEHKPLPSVWARIHKTS